MSIALLSDTEIEDIVRRVASSLADELRDDIESRRVPELMTKREVADYLRCSTSKVNRQMRKGLPYELFEASPLFRKSKVDSWLERQVVQEAG